MNLVAGISVLLFLVCLLCKNADCLVELKTRGDSFENITCSNTEECAAVVNGSECGNGLCSCPLELPVFVNASSKGCFCLQVLNLTEGNCSYSQQCAYDHGMCSKDICACAQNYVAGDGVCEEKGRNPYVPIIVGSVIAVALLGTLAFNCYLRRKPEPGEKEEDCRL